MQRFIKLSAVMAAVIAAPAFAAPTLDANLELDTKAQGQGRGMSQGGRVEFNIAGKAGDDNGFVAGRGTLLVKSDGTTGADDMWGQIGTKMADVKFGRFEAADLFPAGKDVYVDSAGAASGYRANKLRGRFDGNPAHLALSVNAGAASFELGVAESKTTGEIKGVRPVVSFNAGPASVKLGLESAKTVGGAKYEGFGATVGLNVAGGTVNLNAANGKNKTTNVKDTSVGVTAVFGPAGVAYVQDKTGSVKQNTIYAAYSIPLWNTGATVTPAISSSSSSGVQTKSGVAVRVNYAF